MGPGSSLHAAIEADTLSSIILYGPAGTGKTSIAHIIAETTRATFVEVSAIGGTVADLRREIAAAEKRLLGTGARTILFRGRSTVPSFQSRPARLAFACR